MADKQSAPITFRHPPTEARLEERSNAHYTKHQIAKRDLLRHYDLLDEALRRVNFTPGEVALLSEVIGRAKFSAVVDDSSWRYLAAEVEVVGETTRLGARYHVDTDRLVATLRAMHPAEVLAVIDAIERYRNDPRPERLAALGLVKEPVAA